MSCTKAIFMKIAKLLMLSFLALPLFAQQTVSKWSPLVQYQHGAVVEYGGIQYIAQKSVKGKIPTDSMPVLVYGEIPEDYEPESWARLVPVSTGTDSRLFWAEHNMIASMYFDSPFFMPLINKTGMTLTITGCGLLREEAIVGSIHSAWNNFLYSSNPTPENHGPLPKIDSKSLPEVYTQYRRYIHNNLWQDHSMSDKIQQAIHNIGDAGVPYSHALSGYFKEGSDEIRQLRYEYMVKHVYESSDELGSDCNKGGYPGSIYDAISTYYQTAIQAIEWARSDAGPNIGNTLFKDREKYKTLIWGTGNPTGMIRNALTMGFNVLTDIMLASLPLTDAKIEGPALIKSLPKDATYTFVASATDPDAIIMRGDGTYYHDRNCHPMSFAWDINGDGVYGGTGDKKGNAINLKYSDLNVVNGKTTIKVKIIDDEGCEIVVEKIIDCIKAQTPIPVFTAWEKKNSRIAKHIALSHTNPFFSSPFLKPQNIIVSQGSGTATYSFASGFASQCYDTIIIDGFTWSTDPDEPISGQIRETRLDYNNQFSGFVGERYYGNIVKDPQSCVTIYPSGYSIDCYHISEKIIGNGMYGEYSYGYAPNEMGNISGLIKDNENQEASIDIPLAFLIPPVVTRLEMTGNVLSPGNALFTLNVVAHDPDNRYLNNSGISSNEWVIVPSGSISNILSNPSGWPVTKFTSSKLSMTYRELVENNYTPGTYDVFLKVTDDDSRITKLPNGSGVTMTKVGMLTLKAPDTGDVNLDGSVDKMDRDIVRKNLGTTPSNTTWISKWLSGDLDQNGVINNADFTIILKKVPIDQTPINMLLLD